MDERKLIECLVRTHPLSLRDIGRETGIQSGNLSQYLKGAKTVSEERLNRLRRFLHIVDGTLDPDEVHDLEIGASLDDLVQLVDGTVNGTSELMVVVPKSSPVEAWRFDQEVTAFAIRGQQARLTVVRKLDYYSRKEAEQLVPSVFSRVGWLNGIEKGTAFVTLEASSYDRVLRGALHTPEDFDAAIGVATLPTMTDVEKRMNECGKSPLDLLELIRNARWRRRDSS